MQFDLEHNTHFCRRREAQHILSYTDKKDVENDISYIYIYIQYYFAINTNQTEIAYINLTDSVCSK